MHQAQWALLARKLFRASFSCRLHNVLVCCRCVPAEPMSLAFVSDLFESVSETEVVFAVQKEFNMTAVS